MRSEPVKTMEVAGASWEESSTDEWGGGLAVSFLVRWPLRPPRASDDALSTSELGLVMIPHSRAIAWAVRAKSPVT